MVIKKFSLILKMFQVRLDKIVNGRAYSRRKIYYIELVYLKAPCESSNSVQTYCSKVLTENNSRKESKNSSFASIKTLKAVDFKNEILLFSVNSRAEWEKWSKGLLSCIRANF